MNRIRILSILIFFSSFVKAEQPVLRDTSYTVYSAYQKYKKDYPSIKIVRLQDVSDAVQKRTLPYVLYRGRTLVLDLYTDTSSAELNPGVLLVHGGGWRTGDKSLMAPLAAYLAKKGYVSAALEYRLSPEAQYPAAIEDINAAVDWMRQRGPEFGIDTTRIAILGCSAGAQMAGLVGLKFGSTARHQKRIHAIINIDGIMDFTSEEARKYEDDPAKETTSAGSWFGGRYNEKPELWKDASPVYYVDRNAPPILFVNSSQPRFHAGRDEVVSRLDALGIYSEIHTFKDAPHSFWLFDPWFEQTARWVVQFLNMTF